MLAWIARPVPAADPWSLSGKAGLEIDGLGESFGSGTIFRTQTAIDPISNPTGTSLNEAIEALRFRDETTQGDAVFGLRLDRSGTLFLHANADVHSGETRTQGNSDLNFGGTFPAGTVAFDNRVYFQGGPDAGGSGFDDVASATWSRRRLPLGFELKLRAIGERSWAADDSLKDLFDYRVVRPSFELARPIGWSGQLALRGGLGQRWVVDHALGAYRERWVEGEWSQALRPFDHVGLTVRTERRSYSLSDTLTPSYEETAIEGNAAIPMPFRLRLRLDPEFRRTAYTPEDSLVFRDDWTVEGTVKLEASLDRLRGEDEGEEASGNDWTLSLGGRFAALRNRTAHDSDYDAAGGLLGLTRTSLHGFWIDLTGEAGRRTYRVSGGSHGILFEGINISLSGTDYTYLSSSLLAEAPLKYGLKLELFGLIDQEYHTARSDDFGLWSFTTGLVRSF